MIFSWFAFIFGLLAFLFCRRAFDTLSILMASSLYFAFPILLNDVFGTIPGHRIPIPLEIRCFISLYIILLSATLFFQKGKEIKLASDNMVTEWLILFVFVSIAGLIILLKNPNSFWPETIDNPTSTADLGLFFVLFSWGSLWLVWISLFLRSHLYCLVSLVPVFCTLTLGSRAFLTATVLLLFLKYFNTQGQQRLVTNSRFFACFGILFVFLIGWKLAFQYVLVGDFQAIFEALSSPQAWSDRLLRQSQANFVILNFIGALDPLVMTANSYREIVWISSTPYFGGQFLDSSGLPRLSFGDIVQSVRHSDVTFGIGSSFWGSIYHIGRGWVVTYILLFLFCYACFLLNRYWSGSIVGRKYLTVFLCYGFMFHSRLEIQQLTYIMTVNLLLGLSVIFISSLKQRHSTAQGSNGD